MKTRTLRCVLVALLILAAPAAFGDDVAADEGLRARSFELGHKSLEKAATLINPLLSDDGSVSLLPARSVLVVTDYAENLARITEALAQYDTPPRHFSVEVTLISASRDGRPRDDVPEDLRAIARKLSAVLRFNSFEKVASIRAEGNEGDPVTLALESGYHASFDFGEFDPVTKTIRIEQFRLDRLGTDQREGETLLKTALNLRIGQVVVLGASRGPDSGKALMIVLVAEETE